VCLISPEFLPTWGGIGTYTYNLARGLSKIADVHVLTASLPPDGTNGFDPENIHSVFPTNRSHRAPSQFRFQLAVLRRLPELARRHSFEVLHANHAYMSDFFSRFRRTGAARVLTVHSTLDTQIRGTREAGAGSPQQRVEGNLARWRFVLQALEGHYLGHTPSMIFVSRWVRDRTLSRYGVRPRVTAVIPNAVDTNLFAPEPNGAKGDDEGLSRTRTLLFAGRLLALKGIDTLLRAMIRTAPDVRLLLAGPGDAGSWAARARRLGLPADRCQFLGPVPYAEMPALYRRADAVVLPSFAESCPMVALEAMASGIPLIAASAGGLSEIVRDGETGWLFPPGDADRLAAQIGTVLGDPGRARQVQRNARSWVDAQAGIDAMAAQTMWFYEQALEGEAS